MEKEITFILPTRNRRKWVMRAIDSCLACENGLIKPRVIVIDGQSEDNTFVDVQETYGSDGRVELVQQEKNEGFMSACFQGVDLVRTEFSTFMYDDDVLSPYFGTMISYMFRQQRRFIMGYGGEYDANDLYPFKRIHEFNDYSPLRLLLGYFGHTEYINYSGLPANPICCVVTTDSLRKWVGQVNRFAKKNRVREYFMLKRNIGPDLMIYLLAILEDRGEVSVASAIVAQFSVHSNAMSMRYGERELTVGYWLAKIWAFERLCERENREESAICAAYLILYGARILLRRLGKAQLAWSGSICVEIAGILLKIFKQGIGISTFGTGFSFLHSRYRGRVQKVRPL